MRRNLVFLVTIALATAANADFREFKAITADPSLETRVRRAAELSLAQLPQLKADDLAITVVNLTNPALPARADYHGDIAFYPASVIKIFFMTGIYVQHKEKLGDVERALKEMIGESDNDATAYIVDILADTTGGPMLEGRHLRRFIDKRRGINRIFTRLGYDISAMMKTWSFGPYGRDLQVLGPNKENRNRLTANATASLMLWIARRRAPSAEAMLGLLSRPINPPDENEKQIGSALPEDAKLWSKAGWTSAVRHDAAYFELPDGRKYVVVIFTRIGERTIAAVAKNVISELTP